MVIRLRGALPSFGALLLAGCAAVGPNYRVPEHALVNAPAAQGGFTSMSPAVLATDPPDDWWRLYDDPRLDGFVQRALTANTDLRLAEANLERAHALLAEARTGREVSAATDFEQSYVQQSAEASLQHIQPPEKYTYNLGFTVSYDLDLFGGIRRGIEAASAEDEVALGARDLARVNVAAETTRAYADICDAGHELAITERSEALQRQQLQLTQLLRRNGRVPDFEVTRQQGLVSEVIARIPTLRARQLNAAYRLTTLMGEPPENYDRGLLTCTTTLRLMAPIPVGDGRTLLARRPDVRAAERRLAAATARIGVATAQLYPDIKLGGSVGSTGANADFLSALTNRFGFGPAISWDLHRSAIRDRIQQSEAVSRGMLAAFDGTVLGALRETESALNSYSASLDRLSSLESARQQAALVADTTEQLRRGGRVSALTALDAQRTLVNADQALAAAETETSQNQIAIFLALGGGWKSSPPSVEASASRSPKP